jgi:methylation protein EvaC
MIQEERNQGRYVVGYGAPAKATTLLNFCEIYELPFTVDTTLAKQNRYIPGTSTTILPPAKIWADDPAATYLLLAWNYLSQIIRKHPTSRWIVPIPSPVIL